MPRHPSGMAAVFFILCGVPVAGMQLVNGRLIDQPCVCVVFFLFPSFDFYVSPERAACAYETTGVSGRTWESRLLPCVSGRAWSDLVELGCLTNGRKTHAHSRATCDRDSMKTAGRSSHMDGDTSSGSRQGLREEDIEWARHPTTHPVDSVQEPGQGILESGLFRREGMKCMGQASSGSKTRKPSSSLPLVQYFESLFPNF